MLWEYIKELVKAALEAAETTKAIVEFVVITTAVFLPNFLKETKDEEQLDQSLGKKLIYKFRVNAEWRIGSVVVLFFFIHVLLISPYRVYKGQVESAERAQADPSAPKLQEELRQTKQQVSEKDKEVLAAKDETTMYREAMTNMASSNNACDSSTILKDVIAKLTSNWPRTYLTNNRVANTQHARTIALLENVEKKAEVKDRAHNSLMQRYPLWTTMVSKFKELLEEPAKRYGGGLSSAPFPSFDSLLENNDTYFVRPIQVGTSKNWHARYQVRPDDIYIDCWTDNDLRTVLHANVTDNQFSIDLQSQLPDENVPILQQHTNCPVSSMEEFKLITDEYLRTMLIEQNEL